MLPLALLSRRALDVEAERLRGSVLGVTEASSFMCLWPLGVWTTAGMCSPAVFSLAHFFLPLGQVRNRLSVTSAICGSSRSTILNATSGYTVVKSLTSVNDVISVFLGQTDY